MREMRELTLIVNPIAGRGRSARHARQVEDTLRSAGWALNVVHSRSGAHIEALTAAARPGQLIAVLSGDGGIGRAAAGAVRSGAVIAPLPGGRGNDLIRSLGLAHDPVTVASRLTLAQERALDVAFVNGRAFLGVASVGFDSVANRVANETRTLRGPLIYAYAGFIAFLRHRHVPFTVRLDGRELRTFTGWNVAVGNSGRYGGGMRVCPDASLTDGRLDVVTIGPVPRTQFPRMLRDIFRGTHVHHPLVHGDRGQVVEIHAATPEPLTVFADGDPLASLPATLTVQPGALRVLI